jgi:hypothetical protein
MLRRWALVMAALALMGAAPVTPVGFIRGVYAAMVAAEARGVGEPIPSESLYSPRLRALVAAARRAAHGEEACGMDFIFWVDGQDANITSVAVADTPGPSGTADTVVAKFDSLGQPHELQFSFVRVRGAWKLDDVASVGANRWVWSQQLQCQG